jgi:hypothetical protein
VSAQILTESAQEAASGTARVERILALDPGKTTGYVEAYYTTDHLTIGVYEDVYTPREMYDYLKAWLAASNAPTTIIYETFEYRNRARSGLDLTPVKLIGVIEIFKERHHPLVGFVKQSAATGKAFFNDDRLKQMGAYMPGKKHGRDATRHLLQWANFGAGAQHIDLSRCEIFLT